MLISDIDFIGDVIAVRLADRGYRTTQDLSRASAEELLSVEGIGIRTVYRLLDVEEEPQAVIQ